MGELARDDGYVDVPGGRVYWRSVGRGGVPLLVLHGGPGFSHDYLDSLEDLGERRKVVFYDQLGSGKSDRPDDESLWVVQRFIDELITIRNALGLDRIHLFGSSWGGMLGMEYILRDHPDLVSFVNCSGPASIPVWEANTRKLLKGLPEATRTLIEKHEANGTYDDDEYQRAMFDFYRRHVCRLKQWPDGLVRAFELVNSDVYMYMQGPSEFTIVGTLRKWDIMDRLGEIDVPTLLTCGRFDECRPDHMEEMQRRVPNARLRIFEKSSHTQFHEERGAYMSLLNDWFDETEL